MLSIDRQAGYQDALAAAGIAVDPGFVEQGEFTIDGGARACSMLLRRKPQITALFGVSDETAMGAINASRHAGKRVPEDVVVAGFDGLEFGAAFFPPLTTIVQPRVELGATAMRLLHEQIVNPLVPRQTIILDATLAVRESTARFV